MYGIVVETSNEVEAPNILERFHEVSTEKKNNDGGFLTGKHRDFTNRLVKVG